MEYYTSSSSSDQLGGGFLEELLPLKPHHHHPLPPSLWESTFLPKPPDFTFFNNNAIIGSWAGFHNSSDHPNPLPNLPHFHHHIQTPTYLQQDFSSSPFHLNSLINVVHDHSNSNSFNTISTETHPPPLNNNVNYEPPHDHLDYPPMFSDFDDPPDPNFCKNEPLLQVPPPAQEGLKIKKKKIDGQPSKNLMAERRRRKRLNDRLSMLRSVVPKISKMDRTSILGDTIDYMKELIDRINKLQEEIEVGCPDQHKLITSIFNDIHDHAVKPNEPSSSSSSSFLIRNSPKFDVERKSENKKLETRIEICCAPKPGLLVSTVQTLEALDLEIQHCVISCFNEFAFKASCSSQELEHSGILMSSEDIKQALFRNAGYGGRCL